MGLDPLFIDEDGADNTPGTPDDDLRLADGSPCVNRTHPLFVPAHPEDLDGEPRIQECIVDLGAYESADADSLLPDCNKNGVQDPCDLSAQTSVDCNINLVPDDGDIAGGASLDVDINGIPDECQGVPTNDNCFGAKIVQSGTTAVSTLFATTDGPAEPAGCGFAGDAQIHNDVWFRYVAQCAGIVTVSLCGANFDARMAAYVGCPAQSGQMIACSDNVCGTSPRLSFANTGPLVYRIRVGSGNGTIGGGPLVISCTPSPQCPGDANGDGNVNITDLLLVISNWGQAGLNPADINGDNVVNIADLLAVIAAWGACE